MVVAGLSIFRSMKRVTDDADPSGYSAGDIAQLMGDAAGIGAISGLLAPAAELFSLATAGAAAGADVYSPREALARMRKNFGQLGYMRGVLDENVSQGDGQLAGVDGAPGGEAATTAGPPPRDLSALSDKDLRAARATWAESADAEYDALLRIQDELNDLDDRRQLLAQQVDAVGDLLDRLDESGAVALPGHLVDALGYARGWYLAGDGSQMAAAFQESRKQAQASPRPLRRRSIAVAEAAGVGSPSFADWAAANNVTDGRLAVLEALGGLERWCGFFDALAETLQQQLAQTRLRADGSAATRRALAQEIQRRTLEAKPK
jgi:hypothetical protein